MSRFWSSIATKSGNYGEGREGSEGINEELRQKEWGLLERRMAYTLQLKRFPLQRSLFKLTCNASPYESLLLEHGTNVSLTLGTKMVFKSHLQEWGNNIMLQQGENKDQLEL